MITSFIIRVTNLILVHPRKGKTTLIQNECHEFSEQSKADGDENICII
jgi:hypothetical protein